MSLVYAAGVVASLAVVCLVSSREAATLGALAGILFGILAWAEAQVPRRRRFRGGPGLG